MYRKYGIFTLIFSLFCSLSAISQDSVLFKPSGKVIAVGFLDYGAGLGRANSESGFNLTRAYLGYNYRINPNLIAQVVIDGAAGTSAEKYEIAVKNAYLQWNKGEFSASVGMIGFTQFNLQEKYWGHRYVEKSFQDRNKMVSSADLGFNVSYRVCPYVSIDGALMNGEGYKKVSKNNSNRYALGMNIFPVKGIVVRGFISTYTDSEKLRDTPPADMKVDYTNENAMSFFLGYQNKKINAGVEFAKTFNKGFIKKQNYYGYSGFVSYNINSQFNIYGRYDYLDSEKPSDYKDRWSDSDGHFIVGGIEYQPFKQVKLSPNFRNFNPLNGKSSTFAYLSLEFKL